MSGGNDHHVCVTERRFLSPEAVAEKLSVSRRTFFNMLQDGRFGPAATNLGPRLPRFDEAEVSAWIAESAKLGRPIRRREWQALRATEERAA